MDTNFMQYARNPMNWKPTRKKVYSVWACVPKQGTKVHNLLEGSNYITSLERPMVLCGTVGEMWVIDLNKFARTYVMPDGRAITKEALQSMVRHIDGMECIEWFKVKTMSMNQPLNFAIPVPLSIKNFPVNTSWGDVLYANRTGVRHGKGDFLVCASQNGMPCLSDMWVVNGEVFPTTYRLNSFPNMFIGASRNADMPKPKSMILWR